MKKLIGLMIALTIVFSLCVYGGQATAEQKAESSTAVETDTKEVTEAASESADADSGGVTQEQIEENIVGMWMLSEQDGQPALTNEKGILDIISTTEAYISVSSTNGKAPWIDRMESEININDNVVTIAFDPHEGVLIKNEFAITDISDDAFSADYTYSRTTDNSGTSVSECTVKYVRIDDDLSDDIIGTWEGHCTSEGSVFDDGQDHRWKYKDDGTYIYYVKDGEDWVPSENTLNEYFVAGNLLCTRWMEDDEEYREWWEISIDGDKMNWTALREGEDGNTFTVSFEMKRVEDASGEVTQVAIEKMIVGKWITTEKDGQLAPTNEKIVFDIVSNTQAFSSVSHTYETAPWVNHDEGKVDISGNTVIIATIHDDGESAVHEFAISNINTEEFTANKKITITDKDMEPIVKESVVTFVKVHDDYSDDIIGTWEGSCTSEGSVFDDGQDHRWEYKDDGSFVYYVKNGDDWEPSEDTMNEYFVAGNLLCTRWMENGQENREWWEISIDGDKMNWTALREDEDGKTFTATFEMKRVTE